MKPRKVFLLGAGAALDWYKAPSTSYLTNQLLTRGPKNKAGQFITQYIYDTFKSRGTDSLNFEGLIDIIEQCFQFWANQSKGQTIASKLIDSNHSFWKDAINLNYLDSSDGKMLTPEAQFFSKLLVDIYDYICSEIIGYSYFTDSKDRINEKVENEQINELASSYFKNLASDTLLRIYSLNYDRIIQCLFKKAGLDAFQGFKAGALVPTLKEYKQPVDTKGILTNYNEHCIYHLHGNVFWSPANVNPNGLEGYSFWNNYGPTVHSNNGFNSVITEKGKPLFLSNIITGYSKVQRTNLSPFKQMASAFDVDCHMAEEIIVVGYSLGDEHINDTLRQAKKSNPNLAIRFIVLPKSDDDKREWQLKISLEILSHSAKVNDFIFENVGRHVQSKQYRTTVFFQSFKQYLEDQTNH